MGFIGYVLQPHGAGSLFHGMEQGSNPIVGIFSLFIKFSYKYK